jgi:hypothetical protein
MEDVMHTCAAGWSIRILALCALVVAACTLLGAAPSAAQLCGPEPAVGCRKSLAPHASLLMVRDKTPDTHDQLIWQWKKGEATSKSDFGDPRATTNYAVCIYDRSGGTPTLVSAADIPAASRCGGEHCWRQSSVGFRYRANKRTGAAITTLVLRAGPQGGALILVKAGGEPLQMPSLPFAQDPSITVQVKNDLGFCWDADYTAPAQRNQDISFIDRAP